MIDANINNLKNKALIFKTKNELQKLFKKDIKEYKNNLISERKLIYTIFVKIYEEMYDDFANTDDYDKFMERTNNMKEIINILYNNFYSPKAFLSALKTINAQSPMSPLYELYEDVEMSV